MVFEFKIMIFIDVDVKMVNGEEIFEFEYVEMVSVFSL